MALLSHYHSVCISVMLQPHTQQFSLNSPQQKIFKHIGGKKKKKQKKSSHPPGFQVAALWVVAGNKSQVLQPMKRC